MEIRYRIFNCPAEWKAWMVVTTGGGGKWRSILPPEALRMVGKEES